MQDVALDACCLINLCAAGTILSPCSSSTAKSHRGATAHKSVPIGPIPGLSLRVPAEVTREALYIVQPDEEDRAILVERPINLEPYVAAGILAPCDLETHEEIELFVEMAAQLGDGEAACFAFAAKRGWTLATDDRRARRLAAEFRLTVITTPGLVKLWAETSRANDAAIGVALHNIQRFACFTPRANSPEYEWWEGCLERAQG